MSADCRTLTDNAKAKPLHLTLIDTGKARYVEVRSDSGEPDCIGEGKAHCGATLLRYEHEGDTIRLYDPDHAWVATAIASGKLKGHAERGDGDGVKTSEPVYRNFIAGDGKRIASLLRKHPELFNREPLVVLRRLAADAPPAAAPSTTGEP